MSRLFEALEEAADGAFVTDKRLRINFWNGSAEKILGYGQPEVVGQFCYHVINGRNEDLRLICKAHCQFAGAVLNGELVADYDIQVKPKQGESRWLNMSLFPYRMGLNGGEKVIVHLFRDITEQKGDEKFFHRILAAAQRYHSIPSERRANNFPSPDVLTPREYEVLSLLAKGYGTREISAELSISSNTVRNHVQQILQKLHVHTRLEAVAYAIKHNLVD